MPRRVLIVEDQAIDRQILRRILSEEYEVFEAQNGAEARNVLRIQYKLLSAVVTDIAMPEVDGFDLLRFMRSNAAYSQIPVIVATAFGDDETRVKALSLGANDFILKPYNPEIICHCVRNNITFRENAAIVNAIQRDRLTGLYNREAFFDKATAMIRAHEAGHFVMSCFDIDNFKVINDQYGSQVGDSTLQNIARLAKDDMSKIGGIAGRISADNFAALFPTKIMFEHIGMIERVRDNEPMMGDFSRTLMLSEGRCIINDTTLSAVSAYDRAYLAKQTIKGRYDRHLAYFDETMREVLLTEQQIIAEMDKALAEGQFEAWFQPQFNHSTGAFVGAEVLARWRHPEKGMIPPGIFVPIFERNGFVYEMDKCVWEQTCKYLRKWIDEGRNPLPVSVNISRFDVFCSDFVDTLSNMLKRYELSADMLRLEITETAFTESNDQIIPIVQTLMDMGFTVEIDDFGSGYSSLNTLKDVPAQILKLDMKFLENNNDAGRGGSIIESVVRMAKWLDMSVIAEGVETKEQADFLSSIGCSLIQGYLYARPMPADEYELLYMSKSVGTRLPDIEEGVQKENHSFWDPKSIDNLIFNSYVGGACIYEYYNGDIELLRVTEKYVQVIGSAGMTIDDALKLNWMEHLDPESRIRVLNDLKISIETKKEVSGEYVFLDLPGCEPVVHLRSTLRVIASTGDRYLVYCTNENITPQRQAEQRERDLAEQMRLIMANMNGGVCAAAFKPDGSASIIYANNMFYEIYGVSKDELEQSQIKAADIVHPDDRQKTKEAVKHLLNQGGSVTYEYRIIKRDGTESVVWCNNTLTRFSGIAEPVLLSVSTDITELNHARLKERQALEQLNSIMTNIQNGISALVFDENGRIKVLFANDSFYALTGYTKESANAELKNIIEIIHPDDMGNLNAALNKLLADRQPCEDEYRCIKRDGSIVYIRFNASLISLEGYGDNVIISACTDITDIVLIEQRERRIAEQLKDIMDDIPGGFCQMRLYEGGILKPLYINDVMPQLLGMSKEELWALYGNDVMAGVHPDDRVPVSATISCMYEKRETRGGRYRLVNGQGDYTPLIVFGRVTLDQEGNTCLNVYFTDASEQIKEELKQKELLDNLPCGASLFDYDGESIVLIHRNRRYWELVQRNADDYANTPVLDAFHPEDRHVFMQELAAAIENKRDLNCCLRILCGQSSYKSFHIEARIIKSGDNSHRIYAMYTAISEDEISFKESLPFVLSAIMDSSSSLSFAKDTDLRYICASSSFARMVGFENERSIIGKTDYDIFPKEYADKYRKDDLALMASGKPLVDTIERIPSRDVMAHYSNTSKYVLRDTLGNIIGLYGIGSDITRSMQNDSQLNFLNNNMPGGLAVYAYSPAGMSIVYCNDGFCQLFGGTHGGFDKRKDLNPMDWVFNEDREQLMQQITALVESNKALDCMFRVHVLDGSYKWINEKAVVVERSGDTVLLNAVLLDVTERQDAVERLQTSEEENRIAMQHNGSIVCRYTVSDRSLTIPAGISESYNVPPVIYDVPYALIHKGMIAPSSSEAYTRFFEDIQNGVKSGSVVFLQRHMHDWRWFEGRSTTVFAPSGAALKAIIAFHDITEQLEKETVYKRWQQRLSELDPKDFMRYRCNISTRTILNSVDGELLGARFRSGQLNFDECSCEYAQSFVYFEDRERYINFMHSETLIASFMLGKTACVMDYREQSSDESVRWLRVSVELFKYPGSDDVEAYLLFENIDKSKRSEIETLERAENDPLTGVLNRTTFKSKVDALLRDSKQDAGHALLMLDIDGFKLVNDVFGHGAGDQALIDIANALRSMLRKGDLVCRLGGDEFLVFLRDIPDSSIAATKAKQICSIAHKSFSFEVQISGSVGIAVCPKDGHNFESLYKNADSALYHVKGSGKNNYAFFSDNMQNEHLVPEVDAAGVHPTKRHEKKRRMLIVDDSVVDNELLTNMFKDDFIIEKAKDGRTALIRMRHYGSGISVVLLDLIMPGMDGFAVLEKMQSSAELQSIPVIVVSGADTAETCLAAIRSGAKDFITKPVDPNLLRIRVNSAISKSENERLRAKNSFLELQNDERLRFETAIEGFGVAVIEYNWITGEFLYHSSVPKCIAGTFDTRKLWYILLSDMVAETTTVQNMQRLVHSIADERTQIEGSIIVHLKTPDKIYHRFRMNVRKLMDQFHLTDRLIITLLDLDYVERVGIIEG